MSSPGTTPLAGLNRFIESFTAYGRSAHVKLLRAWVGDAPKLDERPTRKELRGWVRSTLAELADVQSRLTAAIARADQAERELAEERERDTVEIAGLRECVRVRDDELDRFRDQIDTLLAKRNEVTAERDSWEWVAHQRAQGMRQQRAELDRLRTELAALKESHASSGHALLARMGVVKPGETCAHGVTVPDECEIAELVDDLLEIVEDVDPAHGGAG